MVHEHWRRHWRRKHGHWLRKTCRTYSLSPCAHHVAPSTEYPAYPSSRELHSTGMFKIPAAIVSMRDISCVTTAQRLQAGTINGSYPLLLDCNRLLHTDVAQYLCLPPLRHSTCFGHRTYMLASVTGSAPDVLGTTLCPQTGPVEFPSTRSYSVDCTDVAQWSSALEVVRKL